MYWESYFCLLWQWLIFPNYISNNFLVWVAHLISTVHRIFTFSLSSNFLKYLDRVVCVLLKLCIWWLNLVLNETPVGPIYKFHCLWSLLLCKHLWANIFYWKDILCSFYSCRVSVLYYSHLRFFVVCIYNALHIW